MTRKVAKKLPAKSASKPKKVRVPTEKELAARFKKGNNANPLGAAAHDPWKRQVKALTSKALAEITEMVCSMTIEEVEQLVKSKQLTLAQKTILRATLDASEHGEIDKFNTIVSRSVGKIPDVVHVESPDGSMSPSNRNQPKMTEEELKEAINQKLDQIEAVKNASK